MLQCLFECPLHAPESSQLFFSKLPKSNLLPLVLPDPEKKNRPVSSWCNFHSTPATAAPLPVRSAWTLLFHAFKAAQATRFPHFIPLGEKYGFAFTLTHIKVYQKS